MSLDKTVFSDPREFGVNHRRAPEDDLREAARNARAEAWLKENADAIASSGAWVDAAGLPLEPYRQF